VPLSRTISILVPTTFSNLSGPSKFVVCLKVPASISGVGLGDTDFRVCGPTTLVTFAPFKLYERPQICSNPLPSVGCVADMVASACFPSRFSAKTAPLVF